MWVQKEIQLKPRPRGFHLVTDEIRALVPEISTVSVGICHLFIQHTSASLTLNENADPSVRRDFERYFSKAVPEDFGFEHIDEGSDDMPAHVKASLLGAALTVPITEGRFNMGVWQGIYLGEHRNRGGSRRLVVTVNGETR